MIAFIRTAFVLTVLALGMAHCIGCSPAQPPNLENAAAVAQYTALLDGCRAKGREAHSYAVYEACADDVDAHLCRSHNVLCKDGGR